ncbi:hypothetical protein CS0771_04750 [Catellatospora sp. IY07-71]|nr:hypothetical protein CS0771_04750 [Catellatospora sp. IY07-71]
MRHIGSFLLALVFAPAVFLLTGTGLSAFATSWVAGGAPEAVLDTAVALGALLLAGALYAVLTMVRLSPVGPFLAGLGLLGMSVWAIAHPGSYEDTFAMLRVHMGGAVGQTGLGIVLAVPLLATVGSPRRWKKHDRLADETVALAAYPLQAGRPGAPADATRQFTAQPGGTAYTGLPDVPPPSLHYPRMTPQSVPTVNVPPAPPASAAPTVQTPPSPPSAPKAPKAPKAPQAPAAPVAEAPPLPRRTPAAAQPSVPQPNTPQPPGAPQAAAPSAPPAAPVSAPAPAATQPVAPPPLPEEQTVMLVDPADQQTIKIDKKD